MRYELMHRDLVVATSENDFSFWDIHHPKALPFRIDLKHCLPDLEVKLKAKLTLKGLGENLPRAIIGDYGIEWESVSDIKEALELHKIGSEVVLESSLKTSKHNEARMRFFLGQRIFLLTRENAKIILNSLGLEQSPSEEIRAEISKGIQGVTIIDRYWIRELGSIQKWEDIDPRKVLVSVGLGILSLTGTPTKATYQSLGLLEPNQYGPETSVLGTFAKGLFRRSDGKLYMLKTGGSDTVYAEYLVSEILKRTNVYDFVRYDIDPGTGSEGFVETGKPSSFCEILDHPEYDIVSATGMGLLGPQISLKKFKKEYAQMLVVDYIVCNWDRHLGNWGFHHDITKGDVVGLHPLFDHNNSFGSEYFFLEDKELISKTNELGKARTLFENADLYFEASELQFLDSVPESLFSYYGPDQKKYMDEFKRRCMKIGLGDPFNVIRKDDPLGDIPPDAWQD